MRIVVLASFVTIGIAMGACGSRASTRAPAAAAPRGAPVAESVEFTVPASDYARYFQSTKDVLRDFQFDLHRVDAASGVITTQSRAWAGFMTPWLPFGASAGTTLEGFVQNERRAARVWFERAGEKQDDADLREATGEIVGHVEMQIQHVERPLKRVSIASARLVSHARDPELERAGLQPSYAYLAGYDQILASEVAERIKEYVDKKFFARATGGVERCRN